MLHNFFLSHFNRDKEVAEIIAAVLQRITLKQIRPWFSSDETGEGGLKPGNIWFYEILQKIKQSKALVAIVTPRSINKPWLFFEAGMAQSLEGCDLIIVSVGVKRDNIPPPFGLYQTYQLTDYRSLKEFISKLLASYQIGFDEEMVKPLLEKAISDLSKFTFDNEIDEENLNNQHSLEQLKMHIDKRFIELLERGYSQTDSDNINRSVILQSKHNIQYSVPIIIDLPDFKTTQFLEIRTDQNVQDVLDDIYSLIRDYVPVFTYMERWILENVLTGQKMIIREIARMIPSKIVFKADINWRVVSIKKPYEASDSRGMVRSML